MQKRNISNLVSLITIQASNALLPVLVFPYVFKILGAEKFSKIVVTESASLIVLTFVIYSFEVNGVSKIIGLDLKKDIQTISAYFSEVFFARLLIFSISMMLLVISSIFLEKELVLLLLFWMLIPLSYIFQSFWFFQGIEENAPLAAITLICRVACALIVIIAIKAPSDYYLVPVIIGLCYISGGLISFWLAKVKYKIEIQLPHKADMISVFSSGKEIFVGNMSVMLFRDMNVLILSSLGGSAVAIATYSMAEKLIKCLQAVARPLNQLFYPKVIRMLKDFRKPDIDVFKKIFCLTFPQLALIAALLVCMPVCYLLFVDVVSYIKNYPQKEQIALLVMVMSASILFGISNFMFGVAGLNHLGEKLYLTKSIFIVGVSNLVYCMILYSVYGVIGSAIAFVFSEVLLFMLIAKKYSVFKNRKSISGLVTH